MLLAVSPLGSSASFQHVWRLWKDSAPPFGWGKAPLRILPQSMDYRSGFAPIHLSMSPRVTVFNARSIRPSPSIVGGRLVARKARMVRRPYRVSTPSGEPARSLPLRPDAHLSGDGRTFYRTARMDAGAVDRSARRGDSRSPNHALWHTTRRSLAREWGNGVPYSRKPKI